MVTIKALGKDFVLKNASDDLASLLTGAKRFQSIIDKIEQKAPGISRDQLLVIAGLELARFQGGDDVKIRGDIDRWTQKLQSICDSIDIKFKETPSSF